MGPQAGANFVIYTMFEKPNLFHACIINNPFRWRGGRDIIMQEAESFFESNKTYNKFLYITYDDSDSLEIEGIGYIEKFSEIIKRTNPAEFKLSLNFIEGNDEFISPMGLRKGLKTLFDDYPFPQDIKVEKLDNILAYYRKLSEKYGFEVDIPELILTFQSDNLKEKGNVDEAVVILDYMIEKYPYSANGYWRLGNISQISGNLQQAREYYRKVLEVHPNDVDIVRSRLSMIERKINESVAYAIEQVIKESGIKAGLDKYREIKTNEQVKLYFDEGEFNEFGYRLLNINSIEEAIEIFRLNVEMYPESANVYDKLGEAYMKDGQKDLAIKNYRKSLKLNPENDNARKMLKKLCEKNE